LFGLTIENTQGTPKSFVLIQHRIEGRIDHFPDLRARAPGFPVILLARVGWLLQSHIFVHIDDGHHLAHLIRRIRLCSMEHPARVKTDLSGIEGLDHVSEVGYPEALFRSVARCHH
jgi:hypothetical protein